MRTIHKYVLTDHITDVSTFEHARFLHVDNQREQVTVWAEVQPLERECMRRLYLVGTGHDVPSEGAQYLGTALMAGGDFVFHVYADAEAA